MKKLSTYILAGAIAVAPVMACEKSKVNERQLQMISYEFDSKNVLGDFKEAYVRIKLENISDKEIIAWSGSFKCDNALGDQVINLGLKDENANIKAGSKDAGSWKDNAFGWGNDNWDVVASGNAENYSCKLDIKKVATK